jgi:CheY-like chemotaxis protein
MDTTKTLLFVDDTPAILKLLEAIFKPKGYTSHFARHGREAVNLLQKQTIDLIILDLDMPVMNGYEFLVYLQKHNVDIPVIVITATKVANHEFLDNHGVTFLEKPFLPTVIVKKVEELLEDGNQLRGISLASFLQLLGLERKSGAITVSNAHHEGVIFLKKGEMVHAATKRVQGEAALYLMLKWTDVKLEVNFKQVSDRISIDRPLEQLLLDIFRMQDEHEASKPNDADATEDSATSAPLEDSTPLANEVDLPPALSSQMSSTANNTSADVAINSATNDNVKNNSTNAGDDATSQSGRRSPVRSAEDSTSSSPTSSEQHAHKPYDVRHPIPSEIPTEVHSEARVDNITLTEERMADVKESLNAAMAIDGALGVALVDYDSGMALGTQGGGLDLDVAAAGNTEVVRAKMRVMKDLKLSGNIEDMLITLETQYHLIRPLVGQTLFLYLVLDRARSNLAMARHKLTGITKDLVV